MSTTTKFYDLTHTLNSQISIYPGDPTYTSTPLTTIQTDHYQIHQISCGSHTGTHLDAPSHFIPNSPTIDQIPLDQLIGPALTLDLSKTAKPKQQISWKDIAEVCDYERELKPGVIVLICTGWYEKWGTSEYFDHPYLMEDVAKGLIEHGIRAVGVDTLNPDETVLEGEGENGFKFHQLFLGAGGVIAENITNLKSLIGLRHVNISLLPLKLEGVDGSPLRAIAWQTI
jgi:kynurenine formamidase